MEGDVVENSLDPDDERDNVDSNGLALEQQHDQNNVAPSQAKGTEDRDSNSSNNQTEEEIETGGNNTAEDLFDEHNDTDDDDDEKDNPEDDDDDDNDIPDLTSPGIVHRSPRIEGSGFVWLVLILDIPTNFHLTNNDDAHEWRG